MANSITHAALPFCVKGARYTVPVPYLDADGDPTDPTTPDTERSIDGASFADCTEEVSTITGTNGVGYITLTGDETNCSLLCVCAKVASGPKATLLATAPRVLPSIYDGTATAGAAGTLTCVKTTCSSIDNYYTGCIIKTTSGTGGGGGSGSLGNQARVVTGYVGSTKVFSVSPSWETNPASGTVFSVLLTDMAANAWLNPTVINNEVVDAIGVDTVAEMAQGIPTATPTIKQALMYLYMAWRNEVTRTASAYNVKNDAGTVICKATLSDNGTTFTKAEFVAGPQI